MYYSNFRFPLDLHSMQSQVSIPVKYGDTAVRLQITLTDGGIPYVIKDGWRAVFSAKKADGTTLFNNCIIEKNSVIRYDFTEHTATAEGIAKCEIILYGTDGEVLGAPRFILVVDERVLGSEEVISQSEREAVDSIILMGDSIVENENAREEAEEQRRLAEEQRELNEQNRQRLYNFTTADAGKLVGVDDDGSIVAVDIDVGGAY